MAESSAPGAGSRPTSWGSRILAPLALIVVVIAILAVVSANTGDDTTKETRVNIEAENQGDGDGAENPRSYEVQDGDTLGAIAEKFDVSTKRLERLNPDIDPQTLNAGQVVTIR